MNIESLAEMAQHRIKQGNSSLAPMRQNFIAKFKEKGLEETVQDSYKFTHLETYFSSLKLDAEKSGGDLPVRESSFPTIRLINGEIESADKLPEGIKVGKISERFDQIKAKLQHSNSLSLLHHGLFEHGIFLEVEKKKEISTPVRIVNILTKSDITSPTHLIVAGALSKFTVIEETLALNISHANISETYIEAEEGSTVEHIAVQEESLHGLNHVSVFAEVAKDANVRSFIFHQAGKLNRFNLELNLNAPGANGETYALFLTDGEEHSDVNTVINHKAPDTTSNQIAKGILDAASKGVFTGKIHIFPKAQRVASGQLNKNLLLSKKAQVHSQPQLEIFADDVKCSHGSTTGQLSPEEIFYFQARGIPEDKARNLLAFGFGLEVVQKIQNAPVREFVSAIVKESLQKKFSLGGVS